MYRRLFKVIILGMVLIFVLMANTVLSEVDRLYSPIISKPPQESSVFRKSPQEIVSQLFREAEGLNTFQGTVRLDEIRKLLGDKAIVRELNRQFTKKCLRKGATTTRSIDCSKMVIAVGVGAGKKAEDLIAKFLSGSNDSKPFVRKAGLLALGQFVYTRERKDYGSTEFSIDGQGAKEALLGIINCLPRVLRPKSKSFESVSEKALKLCESPWDVGKPGNRDDIRWGLISLAKTGSQEAQAVLEDLKRDSVEGTSRHAFVKELLRLHKKASERK